MVFIAKSKHKGAKMNCDKCVFNIKFGFQTGCKADRIQKFIDKGKATRKTGASSYELTQFCNMYREDDTPLSVAKEQADVTIGVVVLDDPSKDIEELIKTVESLETAITRYKKNKVSLVQ